MIAVNMNHTTTKQMHLNERY